MVQKKRLAPLSSGVGARLLPLVLTCLLLLAPGCAHRRVWTPEYKVHRDVLTNGLTILYVEDHTSPVVSYVTWFRVGSSWEKQGSTGIAHLFEHMMFKGTAKYGANQFFRNLESKGAAVNAVTHRDATMYYELIPSEHLETVIDMESDRLANLVLTRKDLDQERQVVKEERRLRVESNFSTQHLEELRRLAFGAHPYGWPIIGYQEDLDRLTVEECREFFSKYYQPGNALVTIAGDLDYEQARGWMEKYYGPLPGRPVPPLELPPARREGREVRREIFRPVEAESLLMGYYIPSMYDEDAERLSMLAWSLFGMGSSRATLRLVREKQIALGVSADAALSRFPDLFLISADMKTGIPASRAEAEIEALIEEAKTKPVSEEELLRVKNRLIYDIVNTAKSPAALANWLAGGEFSHGDYKYIFSRIERLHAMKASELQDVARKYLNPENRVVVVMLPEGQHRPKGEKKKALKRASTQGAQNE